MTTKQHNNESNVAATDNQLLRHTTSNMSRRNNSTTQRFATENFGPTKQSLYSVIGPQDIFDEYLKASFEGDLDKINNMLLYRYGGVQQQNSEEFWNKNLLAFFLAVQNLRLKTANKIYKKYELLRTIIQRLIHSYEITHQIKNKKGLSVNLKMLLQHFDEKQKVKDKTVIIEDKLDEFEQSKSSMSSFDQFQRKTNKDQIVNQPLLDDRKVKQSADFEQLDKKHLNITTKLQEKHRGRSKTVNHTVVSQQKNKNNNSFNEMNNFGVKRNHQTIISQAPIKNFFQYETDLVFLRRVFKSEHARKFNSNMLRIALNLTEDRVAAFVVARMPVQLDEHVMNYAIQNKVLIFIHNVFYYKKNHMIPNITKETTIDPDNFDEEFSDIFTLEKLINRINEFYDYHTSEEILSVVLKWRFESKENILKILCDLGHERIATKFMFDQIKFANKEFFFYCVINEKQYFLKHALRSQFFDGDYMNESQMIYSVVHDLQKGQKIIFNLNLLLFSDFRKWSLTQLRDFNNAVQSFLLTNLETSYMLVTYNPIMAISLMIQYLKQIKYGRLIIENLKFDDIEQIFLEKDFKDRSVLNIITKNEIMVFIVKSKLKYLIDKIWEGKYYSMVDGKLSHFSRTQYLMNHSVRKAKGHQTQLQDVIGSNFKPNIDDYNFMYQMIFRKESINLILIKDFICATVIVAVFQYINYLYMNLFTARRYIELDTVEEQLAVMSNSLRQYKEINFVGTILSVSYILNFFQRILYNYFSLKKIDLDLWIIFDLAAGIANIFAFNIIGNSPPEAFLDQQQKWTLDYYMNAILIISWLRYFSYFMIISPIAKVTLTLFKMLFETISFFIIAIGYLCLMTTIFIMLFKDAGTEDAYGYRNLLSTMREMIDYFIGNYEVKYMAKYGTSHSILVIVHVVISHIFLMNFLVAILTQVYEIMIKNGDFYAIQYSFVFVTKYIKAMNEDNGYDKLILFPPPLNFFLIPLILATPSEKLTRKISSYIEYTFFWLENFCLIILIMIYFMTLDFFIYVKLFFQLIGVEGITKKLVYSTLWALFGYLFLIKINLEDTCVFFNILCFEKSMSFNTEEVEKKKLIQHKFYIYRDCIRAMRQLQAVADDNSIVFRKKQHVQKMFTQKMSFKEKIKKSENEQDISDTFIIDKDLIIQTYAEIAKKNIYTQQYRQKYNQLKKMKSSQSIFSTMEHGLISQRDQIYSEPMLSQEFKSLVGDIMMMNKKDPSKFEQQNKARSIMQNSVESMTPDEFKLVHAFIKKFEIFNKNQQNSSVNLSLVCRAFPKTLTYQFVHKIELINFMQMQKVLIKFYNDDKDEMFNYYDNRMKGRFNMIKLNQEYNNEMLEDIKNLSKFIKAHHFQDKNNELNKLIIRDFSFKKQSDQNVIMFNISKFKPRPINDYRSTNPVYSPLVPDSIQTDIDSFKEDTAQITTGPLNGKVQQNSSQQDRKTRAKRPLSNQNKNREGTPIRSYDKDDTDMMIIDFEHKMSHFRNKSQLDQQQMNQGRPQNESSFQIYPTSTTLVMNNRNPQSNKSQMETVKDTDEDSQPQLNSFEWTLSNGYKILEEAQQKAKDEISALHKKATEQKYINQVKQIQEQNYDGDATPLPLGDFFASSGSNNNNNNLTSNDQMEQQRTSSGMNFNKQYRDKREKMILESSEDDNTSQNSISSRSNTSRFYDKKQ